MKKLILTLFTFFSITSHATTLEEINLIAKELARMQTNINNAIKNKGYDKIIQGDEIPPGPIAVACTVRYAGTFVGYTCPIKAINIGQSKITYNIATCQERQGEYSCILFRHGDLMGYWSPPFIELPKSATFEMPDGYYAWHGTAYRMGYGPAYDEDFEDVIGIAFEQVDIEREEEAKAEQTKKEKQERKTQADMLIAKVTDTLNNTMTHLENQAKLSQLKPYTPNDELPRYEGWCNPRMDDECYLNNAKVPYKDLPKYLPILNCEEDPRVDESSGEPFCYETGSNEIVRAVTHWRFKK